MLGDDNDNAQSRNQFVAMMLMVMVAVLYMTFFMPQQAPPPPAEPPMEQAGGQASQSGTSKEADQIASSSVETTKPTSVLLPPEDTAAASNPELVSLDNGALHLEFTPVGARLKRATVILGEEGIDSVQLVPEWIDVPDTEAMYPLALDFAKDFLGGALNARTWTPEKSADGKTLTFTYEAPGVARVTKRFALTESKHVLDCQISYTNLENQERLLGLDNKDAAFSFSWGPNVQSQDASKGVSQEIVWRKDGLNTHNLTSELVPPQSGLRYSHVTQEPDWAAVKSAYFVVALRPEFAGSEAWVNGNPNTFQLGLNVPRIQLAAGATETRDLKVYLGPTELNALKEASLADWPELDTALEFFTMFSIMDVFAKFLLSILHFLYSNVYANYGVAIILLTLLVRVAVFPLTFKSMLSMSKMQELQPEMLALREEFKEDQQEMNRRVMMLYKERGVNPLGGCFPILVQMPVFIALYRMLWSAFELRHAPFMLWVTDLSEQDALYRLPFSIPTPFSQPVEYLNLLPILMGVAMWLSMKLTPVSGPAQNDQQQMMMKIMPFMMVIFCYNMASGLNLYILVSTLLGIAQSYAIRFYKAKAMPALSPASPAPALVVQTTKPEEPKKKTAVSRPKPRDFYSAAQQKKREMKKEQLRQKKEKK